MNVDVLEMCSVSYLKKYKVIFVISFCNYPLLY